MKAVFENIIKKFIEQNATDLHIAASNPPTIRINGRLVPMNDETILEASHIEKLTKELLTEKQYALFQKEQELDTAMTIFNRRIRVNVYIQEGTVAWALRLLPDDFFPLYELGLPDNVCDFVCSLKKGLVLVTGATGSGKSTTLASIINQINKTRHEHIITIEDPIEYRHNSNQSFISQREVGSDTASFQEALRRAMRQDPDVVLIGEMRDTETMRAALTLAETGHLTFATLHTSDTIQTITRIIGAFPANEQELIRTQLASSLQLVLSQNLIPKTNDAGRVLAAEIMMVTPALKAMIRENKMHQASSSLQTGGTLGMKTMTQAIKDLVNQKIIDKKTAESYLPGETF